MNKMLIGISLDMYELTFAYCPYHINNLSDIYQERVILHDDYMLDFAKLSDSKVEKKLLKSIMSIVRNRIQDRFDGEYEYIWNFIYHNQFDSKYIEYMESIGFEKVFFIKDIDSLICYYDQKILKISDINKDKNILFLHYDSYRLQTCFIKPGNHIYTNVNSLDKLDIDRIILENQNISKGILNNPRLKTRLLYECQRLRYKHLLQKQEIEYDFIQSSMTTKVYLVDVSQIILQIDDQLLDKAMSYYIQNNKEIIWKLYEKYGNKDNLVITVFSNESEVNFFRNQLQDQFSYAKYMRSPYQGFEKVVGALYYRYFVLMFNPLIKQLQDHPQYDDIVIRFIDNIYLKITNFLINNLCKSLTNSINSNVNLWLHKAIEKKDIVYNIQFDFSNKLKEDLNTVYEMIRKHIKECDELEYIMINFNINHNDILNQFEQNHDFIDEINESIKEFSYDLCFNEANKLYNTYIYNNMILFFDWKPLDEAMSIYKKINRKEYMNFFDSESIKEHFIEEFLMIFYKVIENSMEHDYYQLAMIQKIQGENQ